MLGTHGARFSKLILFKWGGLSTLRSWSAKADALRKYAASAPQSRLHMHMFGICYTCKAPDWKSCGCRPARFREKSPGSSSAADTSAMKVVLPLLSSARAMKSMKPMKAMKAMRVARVSMKPMKAMRPMKTAMKRDRSHRNRSGEPSLSGSQKLKARGIGPGHPKYKRLHWGKKVLTNSRKASMKLYQKKNPKAATYKPRKNVRNLGTQTGRRDSESDFRKKGGPGPRESS